MNEYNRCQFTEAIFPEKLTVLLLDVLPLNDKIFSNVIMDIIIVTFKGEWEILPKFFIVAIFII